MRLKVLVDLPRHSPLDPLLDYLAPEPGRRATLVPVPLGPAKEVCGIVWGPGDGRPVRTARARRSRCMRSRQVLDALPPLGE